MALRFFNGQFYSGGYFGPLASGHYYSGPFYSGGYFGPLASGHYYSGPFFTGEFFHGEPIKIVNNYVLFARRSGRR